jgi:phosphopantothenoylcysteine decarboxylase/phosphopantothenate--cysteine ligase
VSRILLGVTGGAAAFKAVGLASGFRKEGHEVDVVMSAGAREFVTPVQFSCITGRPVYTDLFIDHPGDAIPHITLTDGNDLMVVAPATANYMARIAHGLADDLITAASLASVSPMVIAPSMNTRMWMNPATRANVEILRGRGVVFAGPVEGSLACGTAGQGRMMEPEEIFRICLDILSGSGS